MSGQKYETVVVRSPVIYVLGGRSSLPNERSKKHYSMCKLRRCCNENRSQTERDGRWDENEEMEIEIYDAAINPRQASGGRKKEQK